MKNIFALFFSKGTPFVKMHGLGNDFIIIDTRKNPLNLMREEVIQLADRHLGIGCDQLILIKKSAECDCYMQIYNADGSEAEMCGNATRCVASLLANKTNNKTVVIETKTRCLTTKVINEHLVEVDMGLARYSEKNIEIISKMIDKPSVVDIGNPHLVFLTYDLAKTDVAVLGKHYERYELFPEGINVSFAEIVHSGEVKLRVWERGCGETKACGSAACAVLFALSTKGLIEKKARIILPGGTLDIERRPDEHIWMRGPVVMSFYGYF
jgi:diaminopimelate epimerase